MPKKKTAPAAQVDAERERGMGDNSVLGPAGQTQLREIEVKIMDLFAERDEINEEISEVFGAARDSGFDTKILRKVIRERRAQQKDPAGYAAAHELETLYHATLYMPDEPFVPLNPGLADQLKAEDEFEASEAELAKQAGRQTADAEVV